MIFSVTLSRISFLCRFPCHQATEDAVLIGDESEVGVQLEGDIPGVPTADIDFVGLEKIVQNFKHALHTTVPLFFADFSQRLFAKVFVVVLSLMHRMVCQFKVRHEFAIAKKTCPHASTKRKDQLESVAFDRGESLHGGHLSLTQRSADPGIVENSAADLRHYNLSIICRTSSTSLASFEAAPSIHLIYLQKTSRSAV